MILKLRIFKQVSVQDKNILFCGDDCKYLDVKQRHCSLFDDSPFLRDLGSLGTGLQRCAKCLHAYDESDPGLPKNCHDCNAAPGECHKSGCDTEPCSVCGGQWISCGCKDHDPTFARWSGWWPGKLESLALGIDLNTLHSQGWARKLFVKPALEKRGSE